jgi:hypothetical protein
MKEHKILAWKFLRESHQLRYADKRELSPGITLTDPRNNSGEIVTVPELCRSGFHASIRARDALRYAQRGMTHVARVEISGNIQQGDDKICGTNIKCLWIADATLTLQLFTISCRWRQMSYHLKGREPSLAALWALDTAERYIKGETDQEELEAARMAADADGGVACYATTIANATYAAYAAVNAAAEAAASARDAWTAAVTTFSAWDTAEADTDAELEEALLQLQPKERKLS